MATIIVNHRVADYKTWKMGFDGDEERRKGMGLTLSAVGERQDDAGMVYMVFQVEDVPMVMGMMAAPEMQKVMAENGVISAPEVIVLN